MLAANRRPTEKRRQASRANQRKAVAARRRDRSARYASRFRDGMSAVSLERSLALAGESREDYQAHLERFRKGFARGLPLETLVGKLGLALGLASWRRMRGPRTVAEWELRALAETLRDAAAPDGKKIWGVSEAERVESLGRLLRIVLYSWEAAVPRIRAVGNRFEALANRLLAEQGEPGFHARARRSAVVREAERWPAEVLANPLVNPQQALAALEAEAAPEQERAAGRRRKGGKPDAEEREWRRWLNLTDLGALGREEASLPAGVEGLLKLVEGAFGRESGLALKARPEGTRDSPVPDCAAEMRELAEALWERLQVFRQEDERQREEVRQRLEAYLARCDADRGEGPSPRALLEGLVVLFREGERRIFGRARALEYRVDLAFYALLLKRYGAREEWEAFRPPEPVDNTSNLLVAALLTNQMGDKPGAAELVAEFHRRDAIYMADLQRWKELDAVARKQKSEIRSQRSEVRHQT